MADGLDFSSLGDMSGGGGGGGLFDFFSGGGGFAQPPAAAPSTTPADTQLFDLASPAMQGSPSATPGMLGNNLFGPGNPAGGGGIMDMIGSLFGGGGGSGGNFDFTKFLPAMIPGAASLIGMLTGQGGATDKALKAQAGATAPMGSFGKTALTQYQAGQLSPAGDAAVEQFRRNAKAKYEQLAASAGIPVSSMEADISNKVDVDTLAFKNQLLQQEFQNSFAATGMSTTNLTNLARQQALQDQAQRDEWAAFMKQLGQVGGDIFGGTAETTDLPYTNV